MPDGVAVVLVKKRVTKVIEVLEYLMLQFESLLLYLLGTVDSQYLLASAH